MLAELPPAMRAAVIADFIIEFGGRLFELPEREHFIALCWTYIHVPPPYSYLPVSSSMARRSDPKTSWGSARSHYSDDVGQFGRSTDSSRMLGPYVYQYYSGLDGLTHNEATKVAVPVGSVHIDVYTTRFDSTRRRASDLVAVRYIEDSGEERANAGSRDDSIIWTLTLAGRVAEWCLRETGWARGRRTTSISI